MFGRKLPLLMAALIVLCAASVSATTITYTGNAKADFSTVPARSVADPTTPDAPANLINGVQDFPDTEADGTGKAGCKDTPLDPNSVSVPLDSAGNSQVWPSGFNVERVYAFYDAPSDTMYVALVICHSHRFGDGDVAVAWDADGDGTPDSVGALPAGCHWIYPPMLNSAADQGLEDYVLTFIDTAGNCEILRLEEHWRHPGWQRQQLLLDHQL